MPDLPVPTPAPQDLPSLQAELSELVKRSLVQRAQAEQLGARMRDLAQQISKLMQLARSPQPDDPDIDTKDDDPQKSTE